MAFWCIAHRGRTVNATENTLAAFKDAYRVGADAVELDIRLNASGRFVVMHDATVNRTTTSTGFVHRMSTKQIRRLRTNRGERVPFVRDAMELAAAHNRGLILEIKHDALGRWDAAKFQELYSLACDYRMARKSIVFGFDEVKIRTAEDSTPFRTCWISPPRRPSPAKASSIADRLALAPHQIGYGYARRLRESKVQLMGRTTVSQADWAYFRRHGALGCLTDRIATMVRWHHRTR